MRIESIRIVLLCIALTSTARTYGAEDEFLSWLTNPAADVQHTECTTNLLTSACTNIAYVIFSPDRHRYVVLLNSPKIQSVEVFDFGTTNHVALYKHIGAPRENFVPGSPIWYPDGDYLNVAYCHTDLEVAHTFSYDVKTGKLIEEDEERFKRLEASKGEDRPNDPRFSDEGPVWSLGGKKFDRTVEVERAGYAVFEHYLLDIPDYYEQIRWNQNTRYGLYLHRGTQEAFVMKGSGLIGVAPSGTAIYRGVLFIDFDGTLIAKVLPCRYARHPKTISFGARKLESVWNLGDVGILIQTTDGTNNYWDVLDPLQWKKQEEQRSFEEMNRKAEEEDKRWREEHPEVDAH